MPTPTTSPPKPIETEAFGRLFRSRLEARCAVFLEAMGLRWEYEPEGFELPSGRYLPDFKVYKEGCPAGYYWIECKGGIPTEKEVQSARELSKATKAAVMFFGMPVLDEIRRMYLSYKKIHDEDFGDKSYNPDYYWFDEIGSLGDVNCIQLWDRYSVVGKEMSLQGLCECDAFWANWRLGTAFKAANQALKARFEHGAGYA